MRKEEDFLKGIFVAYPKFKRGDKERPAFIPDSIKNGTGNMKDENN